MNFRLSVSILVAILVLAGIHLFIYAQNINLKYQVTDLKIKLSELADRNRQLGSQVAGGEDLAYVEKVARKKLGMIDPDKIIYILAPGPGSVEKAPKPK